MSKGRLLIVDDEPDIRLLVKARLEKEGFECLSAGSAEEALQIAREQKPALIILDLIMPEKDGFQVYNELKAAEETRDIPIIVYTAQNFESVAHKGLKALQVIDFILKPFDSKALTFLIEQSLKKMENNDGGEDNPPKQGE